MAGERIAIIAGSPRPNGISAQLAAELFAQVQVSSASQTSDVRDVFGTEAILCPQARLLRVCDLSIAGCTGCDACRDADGHACILHDDMAVVDEVLAWATRLIIVCPVYFAGAPSQMKALLDRLQPHYWRGSRKGSRRPAELHVVGEGGDPFGYQPLVVSTRSALACAGFDLVAVHSHIAVATASSQQRGEGSSAIAEDAKGGHDA